MRKANANRKKEIADRVLEILRQPDVVEKGGLEKAVAMLHGSACFKKELSRFYRYVQGLQGAKVESQEDC